MSTDGLLRPSRAQNTDVTPISSQKVRQGVCLERKLGNFRSLVMVLVVWTDSIWLLELLRFESQVLWSTWHVVSYAADCN